MSDRSQMSQPPCGLSQAEGPWKRSPSARKRVQPRNRMRANCTSGSVRGTSGNRRSYRSGAKGAGGKTKRKLSRPAGRVCTNHQDKEASSEAHRGKPVTDRGRMFASCNQAAIAFAPPSLCLPADVLDGLGLLCESQLQMATDFCGIAIRSRPFDERSTGMGITGFGQGTLPAPLPAGVF
jgi:hypothetical protein